jgi:predicted  nucleic acid-binding Zn-ribbon protein
METKVLTQEEVTQLKTIQQERYAIVDTFGVLEIQLQELEIRKKTLKNEYQKLKQREESLGKQLQDKYGDGTINLEKGEFISN